jgi:hypothetical protein
MSRQQLVKPCQPLRRSGCCQHQLPRKGTKPDASSSRIADRDQTTVEVAGAERSDLEGDGFRPGRLMAIAHRWRRARSGGRARPLGAPLSASVALDAGGLRAASAAGPQSTVSVCAVGSAAQTAPELQRFALSGPGCSGCLAAARPNLIRWRGDWFDYVGSHYREVEREAIRADL